MGRGSGEGRRGEREVRWGRREGGGRGEGEEREGR